MKNNRTTSLLLWEVPVGLKRAFKARCKAHGVSMRTMVITFMRTYAKNPPGRKATPRGGSR